MPDLHLIGVHEDGRHLLLSGRGGEEYLLPIDDALRAVLRREYSDARPSAEPMRPTEVQAMIRAGANAQEAAERAGWPVEKVHRYEGPILAERAHIARIAGDAHVPSHTGTTVSLSERVDQRLEQRGVPVQETEWDSWRSEDGQWTVELRFAAGGRRRVASWHFSRSSMTVAPVDDEARWLSGDEAPAAPRPSGPDTPHPGAGFGAAGAAGRDDRSAGDTGRNSDHGTDQSSDRSTGRSTDRSTAPRTDQGDGSAVEIDHGDERELPRPDRFDAAGYGSYRGDADESGAPAAAGFAGNSVAGQDHPAPRHAHDPDSELTAGLRERAAKRGRRRPRRLPRATGPALPVESSARPAPSAEVASPPADVAPASADHVPATASPTSIPDVGLEPDPDAVPLQPFDYEPGRDGLPPGAHSDPQPDAQDGRPEPAAAEAAGLTDSGDTGESGDTSDSDSAEEQVVSITDESRGEGNARVGVITDSPEEDDDFNGTVTVEP
uniref:septation protein SepH n=1 Tax=Piscicoccus intestinalis TaxID=746033 RepID=UPI000838317F